MSYLPFLFCILLACTTLNVFAADDEVVNLTASTVEGWRPGTCTYSRQDCDPLADCELGLLDGDYYYNCVCPQDIEGDGYSNSTGCPTNRTECTSDDDCHQYGHCDMTDGFCVCYDGYFGDGAIVCKDIVDCINTSWPCDPHARCVDVAGSFECDCDFDNNWEGDGFTCTHKCYEDTDCHPDAKCKIRKNDCVCNEGFVGDGDECSDIDECADPNRCSAAGSQCINTRGSFECVCANGFVNVQKTCEPVPRDCEEIRLSKNRPKDDFYEIDPDFTGPANRFWVWCEFYADYAVTVVDIVNQNFPMKKVKGQHYFDYGTDLFSLSVLLDTQAFCFQSTLLTCTTDFSYNVDFQWEDAFNQTHSSWAGSSQDGMCGCAEMRKCQHCYCGESLMKTRDFGLFVDKTKLPVVRIRFGDSDGGALTLGSLQCGPRVFYIPQDCDGWRRRGNLNGAYHIDVDGPFGLPPVLVYCDLWTYSHTAVTEMQPEQMNISLATQQTVDVTYLQSLAHVLALVDYSGFCMMNVMYKCTNSPITGGRVYVNVDNPSRQLPYFPGADGEPDHCGCGATMSCEDRSLRCDCDIEDGVQRMDMGDIIDKADLPVVSVTGGTTLTENYFFLSPLRCAPVQFGIPPNCEKLRAASSIQPAPYTYFIDPDGPAIGKFRRNNQPPFLAQCIFNLNPAYGITVIHHYNESWFEISSSFGLIYLRVDYLQLEALKTRSTFCTQRIDINCHQFSLTYSGNSATWESLDNIQHDIKAALQSCLSGGGCQCDGSMGLRTDSGVLSDLALLPVTSMDFSSLTGQAGSANISIGPLECSELFPSCAELHAFVQSMSRQGEGLPAIESVVAIDTDGPGPIPAFEVECRWPDDTIINPEDPDGSLTTNDPEGKSQCFDITYTDQDGDVITIDQLNSLRDRSENCFQKLTVRCLNARVHGMVNYTTCDGVTQPGWAGSAGHDSCQCGTNNLCEGGPNYKCNCDSEPESEDGAVIINKERLPVCQVCLSVEGIPADKADIIPMRKLEYYVSPLNCHSGEGRHVETNCQIVRMKIRKLEEGKTEIVYMHKADPIPVGCNLWPNPPLGQLVIFPEEKVYHNQTGNFTIIVRYYMVNKTIAVELMKKNVYCAQKIYIFCMPDEEQIELTGTNGWRDNDGVFHQHWDILVMNEEEEKRICSQASDTCQECGPPRGFVIYKKTLLPVSSLTLNISATVTVVIDSVRCSHLFENCYEIMDDGTQMGHRGGSISFSIDPDGAGGVNPIEVECQFRKKQQCAVTTVAVGRTFAKGVERKGRKLRPESVTVDYENHDVEQIQALANVSQFCWQPVGFECTQSKLINKNNPLRSHYSLSGEPSLSFGTANYTDFVGCSCGLLGVCGNNNTCYCDKTGPMDLQLKLDEGAVTRKELLPVTEFNFVRQAPNKAYGRMKAGAVRCSNRPCIEFPRTCHEAITKTGPFRKNRVDYNRPNGTFLINPNPEVCPEPFLVYCEMDLDNKIGITRVVIQEPTKETVLMPGENLDAQYYGPTEEQIRCLIDESKYCIQPVLYQCYEAKLLGGGAFWKGPTGGDQDIWGGGISGTCACGKEDLCGGQDTRTQQEQRECNCDAFDKKWRKDGGVLTDKSYLPITLFNFSALTATIDSRIMVTLGDLMCSDKPIEFDECKEGYDDCADHAYCNDTVDGYTCTCHRGWQGRTHNRTFNDDLPVANGRECLDDDECSFNLCPRYISTCENTPGSFKCHCNEGFKQTGPLTCEDIDECKKRIDNCDQNAICINQYGTFKCQCKGSYRGNGTEGNCYKVGDCVLFGDPHTDQYDGTLVDFQGIPECPVIATTDACPDENGTVGAGTFSVIFTPWRKRPQRRGMGEFTWVKDLEIHLKGYVIEMKQDRVLIVDGIISNGFFQDGLVIYDNGRKLILRSDLDIEIIWDGEEEVEIYVPETYGNQLCGLCGNLNGNADDDFILGLGCNATDTNSYDPGPGNATRTDSESVFGYSWMIPTDTCVPKCEKPPPSDPCLLDKNKAVELCDQVFSKQTSRFKACLKKLNQKQMNNMKKSCVYDLCHVEGDVNVTVCDYAQRVAELCKEDTNVNISNWRDPDFCSQDCPDPKVYKVCDPFTFDPSEHTSCLQLRLPGSVVITAECVDGCACPPGYLEDGEDCVLEEDCGCFYNGTYIKINETVTSENCNDSVMCRRDNTVEYVDLVCGNNENCTLKDNVVGCHCIDGYVRIGEVCEEDPCNRVTCPSDSECVLGQCQCKEGYVGDCGDCYDINECDAGLDNCNEDYKEVCVNTQGSFHCSCETGYYREGSMCKDVDECDLGTDECPAHSQCFNEDGDYVCTCCVGFTMEDEECVWTGVDTAYLNGTNTDINCCDCTGPDCDKPGQVCGTDAKTYPNVRALVVQTCLEGKKNVRPMYDGPCESDCSQVVCDKPFEECKELSDGTVVCACPVCSDIEIEIISEVCASNNIFYRSECEFQAAMCINNIINITIITDPTPCLSEGLPGEPSNMGPWSECSSSCGFGKITRTATVQGVDYEVTAVCYSSCSNQSCEEFVCEEPRECIETASGAQCVCPSCTHLPPSPVCGVIGYSVDPETYRNDCELERAACLQSKTFQKLKNDACQREPVNCEVLDNFVRHKDIEGCWTELLVNVPYCKGGCGKLPEDCCYKEESRTVSIPHKCSRGSINHDTMEIITKCHCIPEEELAAILESLNTPG